MAVLCCTHKVTSDFFKMPHSLLISMNIYLLFLASKKFLPIYLLLLNQPQVDLSCSQCLFNYFLWCIRLSRQTSQFNWVYENLSVMLIWLKTYVHSMYPNIVFLNENENRYCNHEGVMFLKYWKFCKNRRLRPTAFWKF